MLGLFVGAAHSAATCRTFCGVDSAGKAATYDLSTLSNKIFTLHDIHAEREEYLVAQPCGCASTVASTEFGIGCTPMTQGEGRGLADIRANLSIAVGTNGFNLTIGGGDDDPAMPRGRNAVYHFVCDATAPLDNPPDDAVVESPGGFYNLIWRHPSACKVSATPAKCPPPPPLPPIPPPPPPPPPAIPCSRGSDLPCLPSWKPTWNLRNSTVLYTCNNSGMHDVHHANQFGVVVYDWSNAKAIWANAHPMSSEELITKQAEMVYADKPGVEGEMPRVWAYRNTIKALNWYSSVRMKLDDPAYAGWFVKFKGFNDSPYPGGKGLKENLTKGLYHVPACDWFGDSKSGPPKCSGFYHDQEQTPNHATPAGGSWPAYRVDGECIEQCDCGATNPCGEYIFNHSGAAVNGQTFRDWWINEYMISNETLFHKNPSTGKPQVIGLGWLDDNMSPRGPSEEDKHYIADTGASEASMMSQTEAYRTSMYELTKKVLPLGGFWWQLMSNSGNQLAAKDVSAAQCKANLKTLCVGANTSAIPKTWERMQLYNIPSGGEHTSAENFTDYTAEFLLTRGPYALLGYSWCGCTNGQDMRPRAKEWDHDYGEPTNGAVCTETSTGSGVFEREWSLATVQWDCNAKAGTQHGKITMK